jgi:enamine deaminase RidA (YjgF/YER057c/UK114 family)
VPDADGTIARKSWTDASTTFFNNKDLPHKPARTTIDVQSLPGPGGKIEVIAASP